MEKNARATKKQRELLAFIDAFIKGNNYGPSYREIMRALGYKSVSTVAIHVNGLIAAGYLRKTDNSARSIEVIQAKPAGTEQKSLHEKWLQQIVKKRLSGDITDEQAKTVRDAMDILGISVSNPTK